MKDMTLDAEALMNISADIKRSLLKALRSDINNADKQQATELLTHLYPSFVNEIPTFVNEIPNSLKTQLSIPIQSGSTTVDARKGRLAIEAISAAVVIVSQLNAQNDSRLNGLRGEYVAQATVLGRVAGVNQKDQLRSLFMSMLKGMQLTENEQAARAKEIQIMIKGYYNQTHEGLTQVLNKMDLTKLDGGEDYDLNLNSVAVDDELLRALSDTQQALESALGYERSAPVAGKSIKLEGGDSLGSSSSA